MKKWLCLLITLTAGVCAAEGQVALPRASLTLEAADDAGSPVAGARASIRAQDKDKSLQRVGKTDEAGKFAAELPSFGYLYYSVGSDNFYSAWGEYQFERGGMSGDPVKWGDGRWSPWNPTVRVVLKRKGEPIPMNAKRISIVTLPTRDKPVGFDFVAGDWVGPYGKGKTPDIFFSATGSVEKSDYVLTWTFPNKGDGIIVYPYEGGARSELRSPTQAPADGYSSQVTVDAEGRPIGQSGDARPLSFAFRVRTLLDDAGKVVSAHYGKIYPEAYKAVYYFNPIPNSRTLEYDNKRNLFTDLKSFEQINDP
ncbi:MAG: hypothetical protein WCH43_04605 [Verrucomicrobiota bacterium]